MKNEGKKDILETPACNMRFCEMAAVTPQKRQCELGSYYPAGTLLEAATSQSRRDVSSNGRTVIP